MELAWATRAIVIPAHLWGLGLVVEVIYIVVWVERTKTIAEAPYIS